MLAKKTSKNQITLPKDAVSRFPGIDYFDVAVEDNRICLVPVRITPAAADLEKVRAKIAALGLTEDDVSDAIAWARKKGR